MKPLIISEKRRTFERDWLWEKIDLFRTGLDIKIRSESWKAVREGEERKFVISPIFHGVGCKEIRALGS